MVADADIVQIQIAKDAFNLRKTEDCHVLLTELFNLEDDLVRFKAGINKNKVAELKAMLKLTGTLRSYTSLLKSVGVKSQKAISRLGGIPEQEEDGS